MVCCERTASGPAVDYTNNELNSQSTTPNRHLYANVTPNSDVYSELQNMDSAPHLYEQIQRR